jgi:hypothetical protein
LFSKIPTFLRFDKCDKVQVNLFGKVQPASTAIGQNVFWDSFNGNSSALQRLAMALIPKDFDSMSELH